jgi:hypothetical protein
MNPSIYAALLKSLDDEAKGLATDVPVKGPTGEVEPVPGVSPELADAFARGGTPSEVHAEPPPVAAEPVAPVAAPAPAKPATETFADKYGVDFEDAKPAPRHSNRMYLPAAISRAGSQLGAALAGVKPDTSTGDLLHKEGANEAAALDKSADDFTKFKQSLLMKASEGRAARTKEKLNFEQADALFSSDPNLKDLWAKYKAQAVALGASPDVDLFAKQAASIRGQTGATGRHESGIIHRDKAREDQQQHAFDLAKMQHGYAMDRRDYEEELKLAKDSRESLHPDRKFIDGEAPPTDGRAAKVRDMDADARYILPQIDRLRALIKQHGPDVMRVVPGFRGEVLSLQQAVAAAFLRAKGYGVPTANDWDMVLKEIGDPTRFVDLVTNQQDDQLKTAASSIHAMTEANARANGYGPWAKDSGLQAPRYQPRRPASAPAAGAPAPVGTRENPEVVDKARFRLNGKVVKVPADKLEQFKKDYPNAEPL